jgi:transcriptional regulator with XRE-family HTH domain
MILEKVGGKIRLLRQSRGYSQESMAELLGMSLSGFAKIERGETDVNLSRLEQIAKCLNVSINDILNLGENQLANFSNNQTITAQLLNAVNYGSITQQENQKEIELLRSAIVQIENIVDNLLKRLERLENKSK